MKVVIFCHSLISDWNHGNAHFLRGIVAELQSLVAAEPLRERLQMLGELLPARGPGWQQAEPLEGSIEQILAVIAELQSLGGLPLAMRSKRPTSSRSTASASSPDPRRSPAGSGASSSASRSTPAGAVARHGSPSTTPHRLRSSTPKSRAGRTSNRGR